MKTHGAAAFYSGPTCGWALKAGLARMASWAKGKTPTNHRWGERKAHARAAVL
eukprot:CAMPEP_0117554596 /NCGR_PEP_ID=MMETSP0784-20121206/50836_1 /TAXON_ID=39447 /ORGANISM="" /LENGTH=52 /DNA_ID=CAMNT_0005351767 /DNA_START=494 /DNA_END=652 /DNA_ORIENTATION=-